MSTSVAYSLFSCLQGSAFVVGANKALLCQTAAQFHLSVNFDFLRDFSSDGLMIFGITLTSFLHPSKFLGNMFYCVQSCEVNDVEAGTIKQLCIEIKSSLLLVYNMHLARIFIINLRQTCFWSVA